MLASDRDKAVQRIQSQVVEEIGADAVVIIFSITKKNTTTTHIHTRGNMLACRGLAEEAYEHLCEGEGIDQEEVDDD